MEVPAGSGLTPPPGVTIPTPECSAAPGTPEADRAALEALYNATGGSELDGQYKLAERLGQSVSGMG